MTLADLSLFGFLFSWSQNKPQQKIRKMHLMQ